MTGRHRTGLAAAALLVAAAVLVVGGVALVLPRGSAGALGPARFVDETATAGVQQTYDGGSTAFVGGGSVEEY